jgi:putative salt-induced outer membrane protein YdiY
MAGNLPQQFVLEAAFSAARCTGRFLTRTNELVPIGDSMRKAIAVLAAVLLGTAAVRDASADEVILKAGDHIHGTVTSVGDGKLMLHSPSMGDVTIPLKDIQTFSTVAPIEMHLADGTVLVRQVAESDPGTVAIVGTGVGAGQKVDVANIEDVNPQPLTGSFAVGGTLTRGNTFTDTLDANFKLGYKMKSELVSFTGEYDYGKTKQVPTGIETTTTDRWDLDGKYEHFFSKKFYGYVEAEVTKDRIAFLDLRFTPSGGVGYQWFSPEPLGFGTEIGAAWLYENYTNGTPTREDAALKLAYHLTYDFPHYGVQLFNDVTYFPSLRSGAVYVINADIGLHAKLTKKLFAEFKVEWEFNSSPAIGALKNDERYIASLGYSL